MKRCICLLTGFCVSLPWIAGAVPVSDADTSSLSVGLEEVKVLASFASHRDREPVMVTTLHSPQIDTKLSNQEFPEILKSVPSVYTTRQGGGYGDSRLMLRGFSSENVGLLINGIPVNGMENGAVYWSNWAGLSDITSSIQVQRGIGLSKMGISSVGGTVNIITRSVDAEKGGTLYYGVGNDGYQKMAVSLSTGLTDKGWAFTMMGTRTWGDGYVNGTNFEAWSYFANLSKRINEHHLLSLTAFGAPQWHNRRSNKQSVEDYENHRDGIRMNTSYGYINGQLVPTYSGYNTYHKPQLSLNYFWSIDERSTFSATVYASLAKGGGKKAYGKDANRLQYNYKTGRPNDNSSLTPEGLIDYDPVLENNRNSDHGSDVIFTMGTNSHDWYGLLSTYTRDFTDALKFTAGIDGRYYRGYHYDEISDLLGGEYYIDNKLAWRAPDTKLGVGDRVSADYLSKILWTGAFAQVAYERSQYKTFLSVSVTDHMYRREDPGKYGIYASDPEKYPVSMLKTDWRHFVPMSVKAGFNYRIARIHRVFVNGGYVTKAPMLENVYVDNVPISDPVNEKIGTVEAGYGLNVAGLTVTLNGYYTWWNDKSLTKPIGGWNGPKACIPGMDAVHRGIELEASYSPVRTLRLGGFFSWGDWRWAKDVNFTLLDENRNEVGKFDAFIKDLHVGNAPQTSAALNVVWEPLKNLTVGADCNYYGRNYADFSPDTRNDENDRADSWKMPDFWTLDLNMSYAFEIGRINARLYGNVNNLLNKKYITDGADNAIGKNHDEASAVVWYGPGITWTAGLKVFF